MKTDTMILVFTFIAVAVFALIAANLAQADQGVSSPFTVLSTTAAPSASMQLVRRGGGGSHGGRAFHGGGGWHGGGRHFHGGFRHRGFYGGGFGGGYYYAEPYYTEPYCEYWTWDPFFEEWVCAKTY